jgi:hypothetical protein
MRITNDNAVQGRLSENLLHEIFLTRNIRNLRYVVNYYANNSWV